MEYRADTVLSCQSVPGGTVDGRRAATSTRARPSATRAQTLQSYALSWLHLQVAPGIGHGVSARGPARGRRCARTTLDAARSRPTRSSSDRSARRRQTNKLENTRKTYNADLRLGFTRTKLHSSVISQSAVRSPHANGSHATTPARFEFSGAQSKGRSAACVSVRPRSGRAGAGDIGHRSPLTAPRTRSRTCAG